MPKLIPNAGQFGQYKGGECLPEGAVLMDDTDVLNLQWTIIKNWTPPKDLRALSESTKVTSALAGISGFLFTTYYRPRFALFSQARFATMIPAIFLPAAAASIAHHTLITTDILLRKTDCPVCIQIRSASTMVALGVIQPLLLSWISCLFISKIKYTMTLPPKRNVQEWLKFFQKQNKKIGPLVALVTALNLAGGTILATEEAKAAEKVWKKMGKYTG